MASDEFTLLFNDRGATDLLGVMRQIRDVGRDIFGEVDRINKVRFSFSQRAIGILRRAFVSLGRTIGSVFRTITSFRTILFTLGSGLLIRNLIRYADAWTLLGNRIRAIIGPTNQVVILQERLFQIAQRSRVSIDSVGDVFGRLLLQQDNLRVSTQELLRFTETLSKAIASAGIGAQEANAGLIQLSQGIASGALRGDELRSVLEQLPPVVKILTNELGVSVAELRDLGFEGKITSELILRAFRNAARSVDASFGNTIVTIGQSFTLLNNSVTRLIGILAQATGIARTFTEVVGFIATTVDSLVTVIPNLNTQIGAVAGRSDPLGFGASFDVLKAIEQEFNRSPLADFADFLNARGSNATGRLISIDLPDVVTVRQFIGSVFAGVIRQQIVPALSSAVSNLAVVFTTGVASTFVKILPQILDTAFIIGKTIAIAIIEVLRASSDAIAALLTPPPESSTDVFDFSKTLTDSLDQTRGFALQGLKTDVFDIVDGFRLMGQAIQFAGQRLNEDLLPDGEDTLGKADTLIQSFSRSFKGAGDLIVQNLGTISQLAQDIAQVMTVDFSLKATDAIIDFADGTKTAAQAFSDFALGVLEDIARLIIQFTILRGVSGALGFDVPALVASANGNVFKSGRVQKFARGTVLSGPAAFPLAGGDVGVAGEAGPEGIFPLSTTESGVLGIKGSISGGGGPSMIAIGDREIRKITRSAAFKDSVAREVRRGGNPLSNSIGAGQRR